MLIINADDWGLNQGATDNSAACFRTGSISSTSAMVFMADSERAAALARECGIESGLHLNFSQVFDGRVASSRIAEAQRRIASFLRTSRWHQLIYNPARRRDFRLVHDAQCEEYLRLYGREPSHINGHHHMHLCANVLVDRLIPLGSAVRRSFSFSPGERGVLNRSYRRLVDAVVTRRYTCTRYFFSLPVSNDLERLRQIVSLAKLADVELMVHPERPAEFALLMSDACRELISEITCGGYAALAGTQPR